VSKLTGLFGKARIVLTFYNRCFFKTDPPRQCVSSLEMKRLIPTVIVGLTFSVGAQEAAKPTAPPEKTKPPAAMTKEMQAAVQKAILEAKAKEKAPSRARNRRVVLPPSSTNRTTGRPVQAQRAPTRTSPGVAQNSANTNRAVATSRPAVAEVRPQALTENIVIQLKGNVHSGEPLDLSLTGVGPVFQADVITGEEHTILSHQYAVKPDDGGYRVEYSIGLRIRMEASQNGKVTNYEYRDVSVTGTAIVKEGEQVVISKNGARELSLTVGKASKK
jgi:hypothetical protein